MFQLLFLILVLPMTVVVFACDDDGYAMYVWKNGFDPAAEHCNGVYPKNKNGPNATCFRHNWNTASARHHLWASCRTSDDNSNRKVTRIFLSDVKSRIENGGFTSVTGECDADLQTTLKEAHERGIQVYALFAVSDAAFGEQYMANYPNEFNSVCGNDDDQVYFDGVAVNNEYFSQVKSCTDPDEIALQKQFLIDLNTTAHNALPLPLHFSVSWNWDCCDCSDDNYETRNLSWNGEIKSALEHMINIVNSVDVQVAYNTPTAMTDRATRPYQYWKDKISSRDVSSDTTALYVLAYTNPTSLCQLSFSPHKKGSSVVNDECTKGGQERTEAAMYAAFDAVENELVGSKGGIHFMSGVYSSGITTDWPVHNTTSCPLAQKYISKKKKCVNKCRKGKIWNNESCQCNCPTPCKVWNNAKKKCKLRCPKTKKWDSDAGTCISKNSGDLGYVWDKRNKMCKLV